MTKPRNNHIAGMQYTSIENIGEASDLVDKFLEDISRDWQYRAQRLQARRWRKIKNQLD